MSRMITVKIDSDDMIEMLCDRVADWTKTSFGDEYDLWCEYYEMAVDNGLYDDMEDFNVGVIVDNDYVNYLTCVTREECIDDYGFDPEEDEDGRVMVSNGDLYIISTT